MRISDWSSDVCSSDLPSPACQRTIIVAAQPPMPRNRRRFMGSAIAGSACRASEQLLPPAAARFQHMAAEDRKSTRLNPVTNAQLVCRLLLEKKKKETNTCNTYTLETMKE